MMQCINALREAEAFNGPYIVRDYCPCINQGIRKGMGTAMHEEAHAVRAGYWPLYRYNPDLAAQGKDPFTLDYKQPDGTLPDFLDGADRYADLVQRMPDEAKLLRAGLQKDCNEQFESLSKE